MLQSAHDSSAALPTPAGHGSVDAVERKAEVERDLRRWTRADVEAKFRRYVRGIWPEAQMRAFFDYAWKLDEQPDLSGLFKRMVVRA